MLKKYASTFFCALSSASVNILVSMGMSSTRKICRLTRNTFTAAACNLQLQPHVTCADFSWTRHWNYFACMDSLHGLCSAIVQALILLPTAQRMRMQTKQHGTKRAHLHHILDLVAAKDAEDVVFKAEEEARAARVALPRAPPPQLVVDPPRLVALWKRFS